MTETSATDQLAPHSGQGRDAGGIRLPWAFIVLVALLAAGRFLLAPYLTAPALQTWATVFVAVCVQALPFLVFGVALGALRMRAGWGERSAAPATV